MADPVDLCDGAAGADGKGRDEMSDEMFTEMADKMCEAMFYDEADKRPSQAIAKDHLTAAYNAGYAAGQAAQRATDAEVCRSIPTMAVSGYGAAKACAEAIEAANLPQSDTDQ